MSQPEGPDKIDVRRPVICTMLRNLVAAGNRVAERCGVKPLKSLGRDLGDAAIHQQVPDDLFAVEQVFKLLTAIAQKVAEGAQRMISTLGLLRCEGVALLSERFILEQMHLVEGICRHGPDAQGQRVSFRGSEGRPGENGEP